MFFHGLIVVVLLMFLCRVSSHCSMVTKKIIGKINISKIQKLYPFLKNQASMHKRIWSMSLEEKKQLNENE